MAELHLYSLDCEVPTIPRRKSIEAKKRNSYPKLSRGAKAASTLLRLPPRSKHFTPSGKNHSPDSLLQHTHFPTPDSASPNKILIGSGPRKVPLHPHDATDADKIQCLQLRARKSDILDGIRSLDAGDRGTIRIKDVDTIREAGSDDQVSLAVILMPSGLPPTRLRLLLR